MSIPTAFQTLPPAVTLPKSAPVTRRQKTVTMNPRDNHNQMALQSRDQSEPDGMAVGSGKIKVLPFRTFLLTQDK